MDKFYVFNKTAPKMFVFGAVFSVAPIICAV